MPENLTDDSLTLVALGVLAFTFADFTHEGLGHGLMTLAVGGKPVMLTTSYFTSSGNWSRWIPAAGGLANVVLGILSLLALRLLRTSAPHLRYFLILTAAFNLLFATAYPFYSGIARFGDWAAVISGLSPAWSWRILLIVCSAILYYVALRLIAMQIAPFCGSSSRPALERLRRITLIPFLAALVIAAVAGLLNPRGWTNVVSAALRAAAASFGLTQVDHFPQARTSHSSPSAGPITRSVGWIALAVIVAILFVGVFGPGIRFGSS